jgi:hypothetical protein
MIAKTAKTAVKSHGVRSFSIGYVIALKQQKSSVV